eukprot:gb/GEZJ01005438.1/.p1 GENE.gb/GEZJ01005438.1/~~gb/GEZJ01005438.1/.p1  ORF type:complete len:315 (-),score=51.17 gb/GEZJ01005438.1/:131-1075(-)
MYFEQYCPKIARNKSLYLMFVTVLLFTSLVAAFFLRAMQPSAANPLAVRLAPNIDSLLTDEALLDEIAANKQFAYFPSADLLLASVAKAGSTSMFRWLYSGITGNKEYSNDVCGTNVQDIQSDCWNSKAVYLKDISMAERRRILSSKSTLRVAIQRNPFDRLISAFNDKFACVTEQFNADLTYSMIVPYLRDLAELPESPKKCMNISEFAEALDLVREKKVVPLQQLDVHIRPQQLHFDYIPYDIIVDVKRLSNVSLLQPVVDRLPFGDLVKEGIEHRHAVKRAELMIPEKTAKRLYLFASESDMGEERFPVHS